MRRRFEIDLLDSEQPFEVDHRNRPHLYKHLPVSGGHYVAVGEEDLYDLYLFGDPIYDPAIETGPADWLMIGYVPEIILVVPLAAPEYSDRTKCRPIGIYKANEDAMNRWKSQ